MIARAVKFSLLLFPLLLAGCHEEKPACPIPSAAEAAHPAVNSLLTYENFGQLKTGMTEEQVRQLLGKPSAIDAQDVKGTDQRVIYTYRDALSSIIVNFINGTVSSKSCNLQDKPAPVPVPAKP